MSRSNIVRVETNGTLVLARGREVRLEGILLPAGGRDHALEKFAADAVARLASLITGRVARLALAPPAEDRYGRLRAQILVDDRGNEVWLQWVMLESGLARVSIAPDRRECAPELYSAEQRARAARLGIWSQAAYRVRTPAQVAADRDTFQIVEGKIASVTRSGSRLFLDFAPPGEFAAVISAADLRNFHRIGVDPFAYEGRMVRVRGWIETVRGRGEVELATPDDVEVIDAQ